MAVEKVNFVTLSGPMSHLDDVALACALSGVYHSDNASVLYSDVKGVSSVSIDNTYNEQCERLKALCDMHNISFDENVDTSDFDDDTRTIAEFITEFSAELNSLYEQKNKIDNEFKYFKENIESVVEFSKTDIDFKKLSECEFIKTGFGHIPIENYKHISENSEKLGFLFIPISKDELSCCGMYAVSVEMADKAERILARMRFSPVNISLIEECRNNANKLEDLANELNETNRKIDEYIKAKIEYASKCYFKLREKNEVEKIKGNGLTHKNNFILTGWIPKKDEKNFESMFSHLDGINITLSDGAKVLSISPPIKLKNNFLSRPFEFYVDMFGLPSYNEIDPTAFVAITYTLLFGIMFGDLGQGIVLSIVGWLMWKLKKMKLGRLLVPCGISSAIFGTLYGSVFGFEHALDPMYKALGFKGKPIEVMESQTINMIIYAAVAIGVTLVIVAMMLNIYSSLKKHNLGHALFSSSGLVGIMFYGGLVAGLLSTIFFGKNLFTPVYVIGLIVIPILAMYLQEPLINLVNRKKNPFPEKWGDYLIQSFFELFETMLSYISNTMSFLRVGAFVLVHAGMMMVVAILAGEPGSVSFVIVEIVGNIFVMALEGLLVGIQVLRLEFYEMFSRFYTGSGRPFKPVKIKEKIQH